MSLSASQLVRSVAFVSVVMINRRKKPYQRGLQAGFTLIEMLVVLAILGLVMGMAGPRVLGYLSDSKVKTAKMQIQSLAGSLDLYYLDSGRYPDNSEGLRILVERPAGVQTWNGPYLKNASLPLDPWGRPYVYKVPGLQGAPFQIISMGPAGQDGDAGNVGLQ